MRGGSSIVSGTGTREVAGIAIRCAWLPGGYSHAMRWPTATFSTPSPTARTRPDPFDAKNLGVGNLGPRHALSDNDIHEVDARERDFNQRFTWAGAWLGALDILPHVAAADAVHHNGF